MSCVETISWLFSVLDEDTSLDVPDLPWDIYVCSSEILPTPPHPATSLLWKIPSLVGADDLLQPLSEVSYTQTLTLVSSLVLGGPPPQSPIQHDPNLASFWWDLELIR